MEPSFETLAEWAEALAAALKGAGASFESWAYPRAVGTVKAGIQQLWDEDVRAVWGGGTNPYTRYRFATAVAALPGAGESELLGAEVRGIYAELVVLGLATWPNDVFEVVVSRPERRTDQQDVHGWPTPLASYLRHGHWIPPDP